MNIIKPYIKSNYSFISLLAVIFTIVIFHLSASLAFAQDFELAVYPPLLRVNIKPGKSITQVFKIDNLSTETQTLVARLVPFTGADQFGNPILDPTYQPKWLEYFSLANSDIQLGKPFEIAAGQSQQLVLSLSVPSAAPMKDLYATLLISTYANTIDTSLQGSSLTASIGSNLLITVSTQLSPATILKITDFSPQPGSYIQIGDTYILDNITPVTFFANAVNDGDFTAESKGLFKIQSFSGNPVQLQSVLPQYIIAGSQRKLINGDSEDFNFTPSIGLIGGFQAQIEIHSDNVNTSSQINLIFLPLKALFGLAVGLSLLLIIINLSFKPLENQ